MLLLRRVIAFQNTILYKKILQRSFVSITELQSSSRKTKVRYDSNNLRSLLSDHKGGVDIPVKVMCKIFKIIFYQINCNFFYYYYYYYYYYYL